jgi:hypothetical protein
VEIICANCGVPFEARRKTAKYHSPTCRKQAQRREAQSSNVVELVPPLPPADEPDVPPVRPEGRATRATRLQLEAAGLDESALGVDALIAAERLDMLTYGATEAGIAALLKAHREALSEALKDSKSDADPVDLIRQSAALKMIAGGKA